MRFFVLLLLLFVSLCGASEQLFCVVKRVIDADTFTCHLPNTHDVFTTITVRVFDLDAFETRKNSRAYKQAKQYNLPVKRVIEVGHKQKQFALLFLQTGHRCSRYVWLTVHGKDSFGRILADVRNACTNKDYKQTVCKFTKRFVPNYTCAFER